MRIDWDTRLVRAGVGELAGFQAGPRVPEGGVSARWRAELGSLWHREKRAAAEREGEPGQHEQSISGVLARRGWRFELEGRVDRRLDTPAGPVWRELKTTLAALPRPAEELRTAHPAHFIQLGLYLLLVQSAAGGAFPLGELLYVEVGTGLEQRVAFGEADARATEAHLEQAADFWEERRLARERVRTLRWRPAFAAPRPGQETIVAELGKALGPGRAVVLAAPTGYGKTGVLLECAFAALREGRVDRVVYLTGKATGQLHVQATLENMLSGAAAGTTQAVDEPPQLSVWQLRPKREHCINSVYHCTRAQCPHLHDLARRWRAAGLARFYLFPSEARTMPALRAAGQAAGVCPYEIARAALPACQVWLADFNHVFAPANRGVLLDQPTWEPERTLLVVDEAHHLPARVAEAYSHELTADEIQALLAELADDAPRALLRSVEQLWRLVAALPASDALDLDAEDDLAAALRAAADGLAKSAHLLEAVSPVGAETWGRLMAQAEWMEQAAFERLVWSPKEGRVRLTCLDAAPMLGAQLAEFGAVVLATASPPPAEVFAAALGLTQDVLSVLTPPAPWRTGAYDVAVDLRVDTTYRRRAEHYGATAKTLARLRRASPGAPVAAFFPSFAYAEAVAVRLERDHPELRAARQPRGLELAEQEAWIEESLALADVLIFVLGGAFAEGIDHLGGRITHALVAGPALPEVNALQRARESVLARTGGDSEAFRRVYVVPGLQKVNQALGRLVRAPGQRARVVLHCRRFAETTYGALLAPEYQLGRHVLEDADFEAWLVG